MNMVGTVFIVVIGIQITWIWSYLICIPIYFQECCFMSIAVPEYKIVVSSLKMEGKEGYRHPVSHLCHH